MWHYETTQSQHYNDDNGARHDAYVQACGMIFSVDCFDVKMSDI